MKTRGIPRSPFIILMIVITLVLLNSTIAYDSLQALVNRTCLYARIAWLYTQEPDDRLAMPVENAKRGQVANTWGASRSGNRRHEGQDIFAPLRTPVYSAARGYVYKVGNNRLGGRTVSVVGAGGRVYYYAHLDDYAPNIATGDPVTTSTLLGYVGTTGNAAGTPPHLHFGVYSLTGAINPLPLIVDRAEGRAKLAGAKNVTYGQ